MRGCDRGGAGGVLGAAVRIVLHGNACPVVEGILEPRRASEREPADGSVRM